MLRRLNNLDRSVLSHNGCVVHRQWHLGDTYASVVEHVRWTDDPKDGLHGERVIFWDGANTEVDVEEGVGVALEPAWLNTDGTTAYRPFGSVG